MVATLYLAVGVLSLLIASDPEMSFCFVFMAGPYSMIRNKLGKLRSKAVILALKVIYFSVRLTLM